MSKRNDLQLEDEYKYRLLMHPEDMLLARRLVRRQPDWQELFLILGIDDKSIRDPYSVFEMLCPTHGTKLHIASNGSRICHQCKNEKATQKRRADRGA